MRFAAKALLLLFSLEAVVAGFVYFSWSDSIAKRDSDSFSYEVSVREGELGLLSEKQAQLMATSAQFISDDAQLKSLFAKGDRAGLLARALPYFERMKANGVTNFNFLFGNGTVFLRVQEPELFGDTIARKSFETARRNDAASAGIELGASSVGMEPGKTYFALRAVAPYRNGTAHLGFIELGTDVGYLFESMPPQASVRGAGVLLPKSAVDKADWLSLQKLRGLQGRWDQFPTHAYVYRSQNASAALQSAARECFDSPEAVFSCENTSSRPFKVGGGAFVCGGFPLAMCGSGAGGVVMLFDVSERTAHAEADFNASLGLTALLMVLTFFAAALFMTKMVLEPIEKVTRTADDISRGNVDADVDGTERDDELGDLARAFERMVVSLKFAMRKTPPKKPGVLL
ncbi:MAG: HAMP domain-containing protein [Candidatus Micrarchaeia archaeon]|jgi:methyl-accepting chemotaxis protein